MEKGHADEEVKNLKRENEEKQAEYENKVKKMRTSVYKRMSSIKELENKLAASKVAGTASPFIPFLNEPYKIDDDDQIWGNILESQEDPNNALFNRKLTPNIESNKQLQQFKKELDVKKIQILELQNENSELKVVFN
jgi:hypothetical protein